MRHLLATALIGMISTAAAHALVSSETGPVIWTPLQLSTAAYEATPTFSADGRELVYMSADENFTKWRLLMSHCEGGRWTPAAPPPFAAPSPTIEADPGYTPDGKGLYFVSARHDPANEDFDIWYVARTPQGLWGEPERLPAPVNSPQAELLPRTDLSGRLYFGSSRPGGLGESDIFVAERIREGHWRVRNLGSPVNSAGNEYEADISNDGRTLVLVADRGNRSHLYRFEVTKNGWKEVGQVPADRNVFQVGPLLSPDAGSLLFAQAYGNRSGEIFRADLTPGGARSWPRPCAGEPYGR